MPQERPLLEMVVPLTGQNFGRAVTFPPNLLARSLQLCIIEMEERRKVMKKLATILSVVIIGTIFLSNCATIESRYTGKRIPVDPAEYEYRDYLDRGYRSSGYYYDYDPYYMSYFSPSMWFGLSFWNPFWYYGFLGSYYYYSPYYWGGYYPYSYYWGRGYYPPYRGSGYYPYRSTYRTYIRKNQLSRGSSSKGSTVKTKGTVKKSGGTTSIGSRSLSPAKTRPPATRTRTPSRTTIKKKK